MLPVIHGIVAAMNLQARSPFDAVVLLPSESFLAIQTVGGVERPIQAICSEVIALVRHDVGGPSFVENVLVIAGT